MHNTPRLVDRIWYFFVEMMAPAAAAIGTAAAQEVLRTQMAKLPWHKISSHLHDDAFVPALLEALPKFPETVHYIFSKIDWLAFLTTLVVAPPEIELAAH